MLTPFVYRLRFDGGPYDGLQVYSTDLPDTRLLFPVGRTSTPSALIAYNHLPGANAAEYAFSRTMICGPKGQAQPTMHFHFIGFSPSAGGLKTRSAVARRIFAACRRALRPILGAIANWLYAPVEYPLRLTTAPPRNNRLGPWKVTGSSLHKA